MDLDKIQQNVREWCKSNGLSLFKGLLPENDVSFLTALWDTEEDSNVENFLDIAGNNRIPIIYMSKNVYSRFEFEEILDVADEMQRDKTLDRSMRDFAAETVKKISSLDRYNGMVRSVDVSFLIGNVVHSFIVSVPWNAAYEEIAKFHEIADSMGEEEE